MHDKRHEKPTLGRLSLGACFAALALAGPLCAPTHAQEAPPKKEGEKPSTAEEARKKASEVAEKLYGTSMKLNKDVATAISLVKSVLTQDPFAFLNVFIDLFGAGGDGAPPDISVRQALDQIIAELHKVREEELIGRTESLVERFGDLIVDPQNMTFDGRLEIYIEDAADLFHELHTIMNNGDPARAELAYDLAPAFNTVTSSRIAGLATASLPRSTIERVLGDAINTNTAMVSDGDPYGGYLFRVVHKKAGDHLCTQSINIGDGNAPWDMLVRYEMDLVEGWVLRDSPPVNEVTEPIYACNDPNVDTQMAIRFDADPIVHLVRRSITEQQLALSAP